MAISLSTWKGVVALFHISAFCLTTFRLGDRFRRHRLWWDDYWAFFAFIVDIIYFSSGMAKTSAIDTRVPIKWRIVRYWISAIPVPIVIGCARISIAMSASRVLPPRAAARRLLFALSVLFGLVCLALLVEKISVCSIDTSWHHNVAVQCYLGTTIGIISLITDVIGDAFLVIVPLQILWRVRLPRSQRTLIIAIFTSSMLSSVTGIVYAHYVFTSGSIGPARGLVIGLTSHVKASVALCVCNLLVVVCYLYRVFRRGRDIELEAETETTESGQKPRTDSIPLTTIGTLTTVSGIHSSQLDSSSQLPTGETLSLTAPSIHRTLEYGTSTR